MILIKLEIPWKCYCLFLLGEPNGGIRQAVSNADVQIIKTLSDRGKVSTLPRVFIGKQRYVVSADLNYSVSKAHLQ